MLWLLLAGGIGIGVYSWLATRAEFRTKFNVRQSISPAEALHEFGETDAAFLLKFFKQLESVVGLPEGKMRLDDRFAVELNVSPKHALCNPALDFLQELIDYVPEAKRVTTVREYLTLLLNLKAEDFDTNALYHHLS
jgi:hypothetical protein